MILAAGDASHDMLITMVAAFTAGVFLIVIARRLAVPGIVLLLAGGALLGPSGIGLVQPDSLGQGLRVIVALAIGLILFEGGLTLDREGYHSAPRMIRRLLTVGVLITWLVTAFIIWLIVRPPPAIAIIAGSLVIVTGPTVIAPLLKRLRVSPKVHSILHWESVLIDPIGVFIAVLCFEWIGEQDGHVALAMLLLRVAAGLSIGVAGGLALSWLVRRRIVPTDHVNLFALAVAMLVFGLAEVVATEAGLLSVTAAGYVFGLSGAAELRAVRRFKGELTDLLIGMLFILLASRLSLEQFRTFGGAGLLAVAVVMFVIRPLSIFLCGTGLDLTTKEKTLLSWIAPRGIVAASMASLFAIRLQELDTTADPRFVETFTYSVIVATIVVQGLTAGPLARRLGLARPDATGWLIIGAHTLARRFAAFLDESAGCAVVLVDTNARAITETRKSGLTAYRTDGRDPGLQDRFGIRDVGYVLALTDNEDLNVRVCEAWTGVSGVKRVFRCDTGGRETDEAAGTSVWPGLPRPSVLSAELERREADLVVQSASEEAAGQPGRILAELRNGLVGLDPNPKVDPDHADHAGAIRCTVRRASDHLLRSLHPQLLVDVHGELPAVVEQLVDAIVAMRPELSRNRLVRDLLVREDAMPSAIGHGVAIPHAYVSGLESRLCALARTSEGLNMSAPDGEPVRLIFLLVSPKGDPEGHLATLAEIAWLVRRPETREALLEAEDAGAMIGVVRQARRGIS